MFNMVIVMQACAERNELTERGSTMKDMIKSLEAELHSSSTSLSTANAEVSRHRSKANQLQALLDSAEKLRHTEQQDRKKLVSDVSEAKLSISRLNGKIGMFASCVVQEEIKEETIWLLDCLRYYQCICRHYFIWITAIPIALLQ